jgi:hypothetical protein
MPRKSRKQDEKQGIFRMGEDAQSLMLTGRLTLKDSRAFVAVDRPDLVILVPRERVHRNGWIQMEPDFSAIAYMARGDRTRCLDIEHESLLTLVPVSLIRKIRRQDDDDHLNSSSRLSSHNNNTKGTNPHHTTTTAGNHHDHDHHTATTNHNNNTIEEGQVVQVEHIILDPSGRRAELLLVPA